MIGFHMEMMKQHGVFEDANTISNFFLSMLPNWTRNIIFPKNNIDFIHSLDCNDWQLKMLYSSSEGGNKCVGISTNEQVEPKRRNRINIQRYWRICPSFAYDQRLKILCETYGDNEHLRISTIEDQTKVNSGIFYPKDFKPWTAWWKKWFQHRIKRGPQRRDCWTFKNSWGEIKSSLVSFKITPKNVADNEGIFQLPHIMSCRHISVR